MARRPSRRGGAGPRVHLQREEEPLETGGGVARALPRLGPGPFAVANGDSVWLDGPVPALARLAAAFEPDAMDALLLLVPHARAFNYRGKGDFHLDAIGRVTRRHPGRIAPFIFSGIQLVSHRLLRDAPAGAAPGDVLRVLVEDADEHDLYGVPV